MRVLVDIVHPADAHFYHHIIGSLAADGHEVRVVARQKDATLALLDGFGIPHTSVGRSGQKSLSGQASELIMRDIALLRVARALRPHVILTRNPSGAQVAWLTRSLSVFDTDDGRAAGVHFRAAAPFAGIITTPGCMPEDYGKKHRRYPGYKALAYLHPRRFSPDPGVLGLLGLAPGQPYHIVRFVAMIASHDRRETGLRVEQKRRVVEVLGSTGRVFVSSESPLPPDLDHLSFDLPPSRLHDALAFATSYVGDSQTMAEEAAVLGTPSLRCSSWTGRLHYLIELERRYGLVESFLPTEAGVFLTRVEELAAAGSARSEWAARREIMLADKVDVTGWYLDLLAELAASGHIG